MAASILAGVQISEPLKSGGRCGAGAAIGRDREPHLPVGRLPEDDWVFAPYDSMLPIEEGRRVVFHVCGDPRSAISAQHARRHGLTLPAYRERLG